MVAARVFALALLALQLGLKSNHVVDLETTEGMKEREAYLNEQMSWLLQEVEESKNTDETTLLSALEQWKFWSIPVALVLFSLVYWLGRATASCSEQESSSSKQENGQEEEDLSGLAKGFKSLSVSPSPRQGLPKKCRVVKELVDGLLNICRVLCERSFMPQLYPATAMEETCETWSIEEKSISYHLLVFLRPPHGHSFSLDPDTTKDLPGRPSNIRVVLECTCWRKELLGGSVCFVHHHDKATRDQRSFLLENLCTNSYLDLDKVARWVQLLVTSAWQFLQESHHCQLTVLPSSKSCRFQLSSTAEINIFTEMFFTVDQENREDAY